MFSSADCAGNSGYFTACYPNGHRAKDCDDQPEIARNRFCINYVDIWLTKYPEWRMFWVELVVELRVNTVTLNERFVYGVPLCF